MIADKNVGEKVKIKVLRNGREKTFTVKLAKRKDMPGSPEVLKNESQDEFGITVSDLTPEIASKLNIEKEEGVVVTDVAEDSKGEKAGIERGDIIKEVNHEEIEDKDDYLEEIGDIKEGKPVNLLILRPGRGIMVIKLIR